MKLADNRVEFDRLFYGSARSKGASSNLEMKDKGTMALPVEAYERDLIQDALKTTRGNRKKAAKLLDTTERIIGYIVKKFGIDCERFRP